ncbi:MAG: PmbA protein [Planctomycetota bacterium]|jgi:PmbA protein
MPLLQSDHALEVCRSLVAASPADETEVSLTSLEEGFVRFDERGPTQNADRESYRVAVRVRLRGPDGLREASASCGSLDPADGQAALQRAMTLAQVADADPDAEPLGGPVDVAETAAQRPTRDHTFREKARWIEAAKEACRRDGLLPAGMIQTQAQGTTLVNSAGREVTGAVSRASFSLTAFQAGEAGGAGAAHCSHANVEALDVPRAIQEAIECAVRSRGPVAFEPCETTVVLMPPAVSSLLLFAAYQGFGAQEVSERNSFLCDRIGQRLFPDAVRLYDDASNELCPGLPFDGEGWPRKRLALLENGALQAPVTDARWARKLGVDNTGHGPAQPSATGPAPENLVMAAGNESLEQLIAGVDDGLLVNQLHYTNMIEPRDLTLTGMTRNGTFRIQGGRLAGPVRNLRFTESLVNVLRNTSGVGNKLEVAGALFDGEVVCPALRVDKFRFTSSTDF